MIGTLAVNPQVTIRYRVYSGPDDIPWLCRMRLVGKSPKGQRELWEPMDAANKTPVSLPCRLGRPAATPREAVKTFVRAVLIDFGLKQTQNTDATALFNKATDIAEKLSQLLADGTHDQP
jgi:hypothetical protein